MDDDTIRILGLVASFTFLIVPWFIPLFYLIVEACRWCLPNTSSSSSSSSMSDVESLHSEESTIMEEEEEEEEEEESPHGLDESVINVIPSFIYKTTTMKSEEEEEEEESDGGDCVICLGEFQDNDHIRTLPLCSHTFHLNCIDVWLRSNPNCPICRSCLCCFEEDILFKHSASEPERMVVIDIPAAIVE